MSKNEIKYTRILNIKDKYDLQVLDEYNMHDSHAIVIPPDWDEINKDDYWEVLRKHRNYKDWRKLKNCYFILITIDDFTLVLDRSILSSHNGCGFTTEKEAEEYEKQFLDLIEKDRIILLSSYNFYGIQKIDDIYLNLTKGLKHVIKDEILKLELEVDNNLQLIYKYKLESGNRFEFNELID